MKSVTLDVPPDGLLLQLTARRRTASSQTVLVLADDVELRVIAETTTNAAEARIARATRKRSPTSRKDDLSFILKRLLKLKPSTRAAVENSVKAMFQFESPLSDKELGQIVDRLCEQGSITIDAKGKVRYAAQA